VSPPARKKQRAYRSRQRNGLIVLRVEVPEIALAEALIASNRLCVSDTANRQAVEHQVADILAEWVSRWQAVC
jgi:hypothetical protein